MRHRSAEEEIEMEGERGPAGNLRAEEWADFAKDLYSIYLRGLGGKLLFADFIRQQLAIDLLTECIAVDQERQSALLFDVLHLLTAEDFEADDDL
jgi:hypothetical protein